MDRELELERLTSRLLSFLSAMVPISVGLLIAFLTEMSAVAVPFGTVMIVVLVTLAFTSLAAIIKTAIEIISQCGGGSLLEALFPSVHPRSGT